MTATVPVVELPNHETRRAFGAQTEKRVPVTPSKYLHARLRFHTGAGEYLQIIPGIHFLD